MNHFLNFRLTGKVETLMCLMLLLWRGGGDGDTGFDQLFNVIHQVLQMTIPHKYSDCSARSFHNSNHHSDKKRNKICIFCSNMSSQRDAEVFDNSLRPECL